MKTSGNREYKLKRPEPGASLPDRYRELLDIQDEISAGTTTKAPELTEADVRGRLEAGVSLISFDDFFPEWEQAEPVFRRILRWAIAEDTDPAHDRDWTGVDMGAGLFRELAAAWYETGNSSQGEQSTSAILVALVGACVRPFLMARSKQYIPMVEQSRWRQRHCPVCGGIADFCYLGKEEGARWLVCSRCDAEWLFQRIECPYCGTQDQTKLAYLTDRTEQYRLYVCDACRTYIKAIDMRRTQHRVQLPLERVLTLELDRQASLHGYVPGR